MLRCLARNLSLDCCGQRPEGLLEFDGSSVAIAFAGQVTITARTPYHGVSMLVCSQGFGNFSTIQTTLGYPATRELRTARHQLRAA